MSKIDCTSYDITPWNPGVSYYPYDYRRAGISTLLTQYSRNNNNDWDLKVSSLGLYVGGFTYTNDLYISLIGLNYNYGSWLVQHWLEEIQMNQSYNTIIEYLSQLHPWYENV